MARVRSSRKRLFVGCEGESERNYVALLQRHADYLERPVYADARVVPRAGDPLAKVRRVIDIADRREKNARSRYVQQFPILDRDVFGNNPARDSQILKVAAKGDFKLIWQGCCFEAVLFGTSQGMGMIIRRREASDFDRALSRFAQVSPAKGSGLGLPIAKAVTEGAGGTLRLRAARPGLIVTVTLPAA